MNDLNSVKTLQVFTLAMAPIAFYFLYIADNLSWLWLSLLVYSIQQFFGFNAFMHRYVSHNTYKTTKPWLYFMGYLSVFTGVGSPLSWSWIHRAHHKYEDTELDPHSPKRMGWFKAFFCLFYLDENKYKDVKVPLKDVICKKELRFFNKHWLKLNLATQILLLYFFGSTVYFSVIVIPMFLHIIIIYYFLITYCHRYGSRTTYRTSATNSKLMHILSLGEGLHNNHHSWEPSSRDSFIRGEIDPVAEFIDRIRTDKDTNK